MSKDVRVEEYKGWYNQELGEFNRKCQEFGGIKQTEDNGLQVEDLWEEIAEDHGLEYDEIADGDLLDYL